LKVRPQAIFSFVFLIFFIVFAYMAKDWRLQARMYPWVIGIPMVVLAFIQLILDLKGIERKQQDAAPVDFQFAQTTVEPAVAKRRAITMFSWFFGFFFDLASRLFHHHPANGLYLSENPVQRKVVALSHVDRHSLGFFPYAFRQIAYPSVS